MIAYLRALLSRRILAAQRGHGIVTSIIRPRLRLRLPGNHLWVFEWHHKFLISDDLEMSKVSGYVALSSLDLSPTELAFLSTLQQLSERQDGVTRAFAFSKHRGNETHCCLSEVEDVANFEQTVWYRAAPASGDAICRNSRELPSGIL